MESDGTDICSRQAGGVHSDTAAGSWGWLGRQRRRELRTPSYTQSLLYFPFASLKELLKSEVDDRLVTWKIHLSH